MIKLTGLTGHPVYLRATSIVAIREPYEHEFAEGAHAAIVIGSTWMGVRETVPQVLGQLGMQVG